MAESRLPSRRELRVALLFFLLLGLLNGVYQVEKRYSGRFLDRPYTGLVTAAAAWVGERVLPFEVTRRDDLTLGAGHTAVLVRGGCNGLEAVFLLLAGILALPASWRQRAAALAVCLPVLFLLNLVRVLGLLYVMVEHPDRIALFHDQIGQGAMAVVVMVCWVVHVRHVAPR